MVFTSRDRKKNEERRLSVAAFLLSLFLFSALPVPASAQPVADPTLTTAISGFSAADSALLTTATTIMGGLYSLWAWFQLNVLPALFGAVSSATTSSGMMISDMLTKNGDYVTNSMQTIHQQHLTAEHQARATMSNQSMACAVQGYLQAKEQMYQNAHGINGSFTALVALGECKGVNAACSTAGRVRERFYDLCYLGFLPLQKYGQLLTSQNCKDISTSSGGQRYIDAQSNINILFDSYQFPAAQGCILADGYPYFASKAPPSSGSVSGGAAGSSPSPCQGGTSLNSDGDLNPTGDPTKDKIAWIAAYKFCEGLKGEPKTPISTSANRPITMVDMQRVLEDTEDETMSLAGSPYELCKHYLWERTAYGSDSKTSSTGTNGGDTANTDQTNLCKIMNASPNPGGADLAGMNGAAGTLGSGTGATGFGLADDANVNNCANGNAGISPLAAMKAEAYKCGGATHMSARASNAADSSKLEAQSIGPCLKDAREYQNYVDHEKETLIKSIVKYHRNQMQNAYAMQGGSGGAVTPISNTGVGDVPVKQ